MKKNMEIKSNIAFLVKIIYEDMSILVIDKPPDLVCNRSETTEANNTLQDWIEKRAVWKETTVREDISHANDFFKRSGLVHRLDKDTSGVLVIAKTNAAFQDLIRQFKYRQVEKEYTALVHGALRINHGVMNLPLTRSKIQRGKFGVAPAGRQAKTYWEVEKIFKHLDKRFKGSDKYQGFSLLKLQPKTGRTHQLRVHLAFIGHPIVGDSRYNGKRIAKLDIEWCRRQFLHASRISFLHPEKRTKQTYSVELAEDLKNILKFLS